MLLDRKCILINVSKENLLKAFVKFPKANILLIFLLFAFSEWLISDLFDFSGGNLGFIFLCFIGYFYFKLEKPKFNEPKDLNGWVKLCEEDIDYLNEFEMKNNLENKTKFRKNVLQDILENHEKQLITVIGESENKFYKTFINKYFKEGTYNLNILDELPPTSCDTELTNKFFYNDIVFYHLSPPLTAKSLLWLNKLPIDMRIWIITSIPSNKNEIKEIDEFKSEIPDQFKQRILNINLENNYLTNVPLSLRINFINPHSTIEVTQKRLLREIHSKWQAEIEVIRRIKLKDIQKKNQLLVAASVFASPVPSVDVLSMTVLNSLMINEIRSIWGCTWSPEILEKISKEIVKTAITQGVVEWSGQTLLGLSKFHGPNWLLVGSFQAISAAYLTRVVSRSLADFMAINKGVTEPDLEFIKNKSEKIVANAFQSEKINWHSFLEDFPNQLRLKFT
tara:strand:- start:632 stop:1984 length:1353 start_codon:yes stop_codon:yes gene_type:complete